MTLVAFAILLFPSDTTCSSGTSSSLAISCCLFNISTPSRTPESQNQLAIAYETSRIALSISAKMFGHRKNLSATTRSYKPQTAAFLDMNEQPLIGSVAESFSRGDDISSSQLKEVFAESKQAQNVLAIFGEVAHAQFVHAHIHRCQREATGRAERARLRISEHKRRSGFPSWAYKLGRKLHEAYAEVQGY